MKKIIKNLSEANEQTKTNKQTNKQTKSLLRKLRETNRMLDCEKQKSDERTIIQNQTEIIKQTNKQTGGEGGGLELDGGKSVVGSMKSRLSARSKGGRDASAGAGMSAVGDDTLDVAGLDGLRFVCVVVFVVVVVVVVVVFDNSCESFVSQSRWASLWRNK